MENHHALPEELAQRGCRTERELDVRPILSMGQDPFSLILSAVTGLEEGEALHLIAGFDPLPLYSVLGGRGFDHWTKKEGDRVDVWFFPQERLSDTPTSEERAPLLDPVEVDVREMEPPEPMAAILGKLRELGPGAQLEILHHREPVMIYEKIEAMGFKAIPKERGPGDWLIRILPQWAGDDD
ncbi:MAG: DUF2249 domain-containing protein [Planctomycetota bacterium]|jgi:uncharacterized protein (DUF2249 family)|nr:DUF2249 domain-containing protein [Planctomycetota bacterium]MDP6940631.1 DUF2249 domain-containing protein [Planctomycetota bacterium]